MELKTITIGERTVTRYIGALDLSGISSSRTYYNTGDPSERSPRTQFPNCDELAWPGAYLSPLLRWQSKSSGILSAKKTQKYIIYWAITVVIVWFVFWKFLFKDVFLCRLWIENGCADISHRLPFWQPQWRRTRNVIRDDIYMYTILHYSNTLYIHNW
jgi:hypothetical protein